MERKGLELGVGSFLLVGLLCLAYLSFKLGDVHPLGTEDYVVYAKFSNAAGLKQKTAVTMAGVNIGQVRNVRLEEGQALVSFSIRKDVKLEEDVVASIKTMGIIGDKYVAIAPGASDEFIKPGGMIHETRPPLDIENLLGKFVFGNVEQKSGETPAGGSSEKPSIDLDLKSPTPQPKPDEVKPEPGQKPDEAKPEAHQKPEGTKPQ